MMSWNLSACFNAATGFCWKAVLVFVLVFVFVSLNYKFWVLVWNLNICICLRIDGFFFLFFFERYTFTSNYIKLVVIDIDIWTNNTSFQFNFHSLLVCLSLVLLVFKNFFFRKGRYVPEKRKTWTKLSSLQKYFELLFYFKTNLIITFILSWNLTANHAICSFKKVFKNNKKIKFTNFHIIYFHSQNKTKILFTFFFFLFCLQI